VLDHLPHAAEGDRPRAVGSRTERRPLVVEDRIELKDREELPELWSGTLQPPELKPELLCQRDRPCGLSCVRSAQRAVTATTPRADIMQSPACPPSPHTSRRDLPWRDSAPSAIATLPSVASAEALTTPSVMSRVTGVWSGIEMSTIVLSSSRWRFDVHRSRARGASLRTHARRALVRGTEAIIGEAAHGAEARPWIRVP